jgi:hypothetical protein
MGTPPQPPPPQPGAPAGAPGPPGIGIAGFVCGLLGLLISWIPVIGVLGIILCVIGIPLSIVGRRRAAETGAPGGLATAGLVCSIIGLAIGLIVQVLFGIALDEAENQLDDANDLNEQLENLETNVVIGLFLLRNRILTPIRRIGG